jgi:hypothetical protein
MLNEDEMTFFVVKFNTYTDNYEQCSNRMSITDAKLRCHSLRFRDETHSDFKVHCELDF